LAWARRQEFCDFFHQRRQQEGPRVEVDAAGFDFGEVENLFDEREQRIA